MSKLTKVVLINWMYFQRATLPINENTAIVGVNGTGKSTIIDAIQMLLLGQKQSKFNSGANAEKRTLESYVRGHVGTDNKEYLRPGDVITYLALEIDVAGHNHVFGINIEYKLNQSRLTDPKYFYIDNETLNDTLFVTDDNYPKPYDDFAKEMKRNSNYVSFQTLTGYQNKIKEVFGLKSDNGYFKILSRAIGLKNITECDKFMNDFVLDESNIDITQIKNNIIDMNKANKAIENEEEKLQKLEEITNMGEEIEEVQRELTNLDVKIILGRKIWLEMDNTKLAKKNGERKAICNERSSEQKSLEQINKRLEIEKRDLLNTLNEKFPDLSLKRERYEYIKPKYDVIHSNINTFVQKCRVEVGNLNGLKVFSNEAFDDFKTYLSEANYTTASATFHFSNANTEADKLSAQVSSELGILTANINDCKTKLSELNAVIKGLENNKPTFNPSYEKMRNVIKQGLYDRYDADIEVKFLCEYLDISNDEWRDAIEGYLGSQRFYLVVPNIYYKDALRIYHHNSDLYGIRLINGTRLPSFDAKEGTLGEYVEASNEIALNYARYILNRVHCVNNIFELNNYDISITKDCMCYQSYSSWKINPKYYKESFIGIEGLKRQLEIKKREYKELSDKGNELKLEFSRLDDKRQKLKNLQTFIYEIYEKGYIAQIDEDNNLFVEINQLEAEIKMYEQNPQKIEISDKIAKVENDIATNESNIDKLKEEISQIKSNILTNLDKINANNSDIQGLDDRLAEFNEDMVGSISNEIDKLSITIQMINDWKSSSNKLEKEMERKKIRIEGLMEAARNEFSINAEPIFEQLPKFKAEKEKINTGIFKYKNRLLEMQKSHRRLFFSEFLSKLCKSIDDAKEIIRNLNSSLEAFKFGDLYYSIKVSITENQDLKTIYDYARKYNSENSERGLFVNFEIEDRERQKVEQLFNEYMFSDNINIQNIIVDYRRYLYFDVDIHSMKGEGVKSLNKVIRSQSGGEVQVPFYILSGVAFKQTLDYRRNKDALGIVLYDEAFDKMDSQRIQAMLQFYRDTLKLQIILAAPGKLDSLADNMETILAVVRDGDKAIVSDMNHEIQRNNP